MLVLSTVCVELVALAVGGVVDVCYRFLYDRWDLERAQQAIKVILHRSTQSKQ